MTNENETSNTDNSSSEQLEDSSVPKEDWVEKAIIYEATPKSLREPKEKGEFIKSLGVPSSTYYDKISDSNTQKKIIEICFKQAKKRTPDILEKLGEKAEAGNDTSIAQFMEYVLELKKKMELSGDKDNPIPINIYGGQSIQGYYGNSQDIQINEKDTSSIRRDSSE